MKNFLHFLQYHNGALVVLVLIAGFSGTVFAANELTSRGENEKIELGKDKATETRTSDVLVSGAGLITDAPVAIDASALLDADIEDFDFNLEIVSSEEGEDAFVIGYRFDTLSLSDARWQGITKEGTLSVAKKDLTGQTLEAYALAQLSQVVEQERTYLARVQEHERYALAERTKSMGSRTLAGLSLAALAEEAVEEREIIEQEPTPTPPVPEAEQLEIETQAPPIVAGTSTPLDSPRPQGDAASNGAGPEENNTASSTDTDTASTSETDSDTDSSSDPNSNTASSSEQISEEPALQEEDPLPESEPDEPVEETPEEPLTTEKPVQEPESEPEQQSETPEVETDTDSQPVT